MEEHKAGRGWGVWKAAVLNTVVRGASTEQETGEQEIEGGEWGNRAAIWGKGEEVGGEGRGPWKSRRKSKCKGPVRGGPGNGRKEQGGQKRGRERTV